MTPQELETKIDEYIKEIPCLSVSAVKAMEVCNNAAASPLDINQVISLDPVLTGRVLQLFNNVYKGEGHGAVSLVRFVTKLGVNTVKNLVLSTAALAANPHNIDIDGMDIEVFWRHCLCAGIVSRILAEKQNIAESLHEEYFVAGLLHDIGKLPLDAIMPRKYLPGLTTANAEKKPLFTAEDEVLHINHCQAGAMIARAWNLKSPITDVIIHHHKTCPDSNILNTVIIANYFSYVKGMGAAGDRYVETPDIKIWKSCGITEAIFDEIEESVVKEIDKAHKFLKIN